MSLVGAESIGELPLGGAPVVTILGPQVFITPQVIYGYRLPPPGGITTFVNLFPSSLPSLPLTSQVIFDVAQYMQAAPPETIVSINIGGGRGSTVPSYGTVASPSTGLLQAFALSLDLVKQTQTLPPRPIQVRVVGSRRNTYLFTIGPYL